jgi:2-haloacid dehalogenase
LLAEVLTAYRELDADPCAIEVLERVRAWGRPTAILSNGEPGMLEAAIRSAGLEQLLDHVLSVETVGVFKPDPRVYRLVEERLALPAGQMAFVSSNPWDAFGAHAFGFQVFWINRSGQPDEYGLREAVTELSGLGALTHAIGATAAP